jgi:uncharacterized membrane protein
VKKYLVAGLLVWLPLAITVWVLSWLLSALDGVFLALLSATQAVLPASMHAAIEQLRHVPGPGRVVVLVVGLLLTGIFVTNIFGQWWVRQWHRLLHQIPIVKSIYSSVKQVSDTLFSSSGNAFREAVLVQYPRQGSWTIAFVTGCALGRGGGQAADGHAQRLCADDAQPNVGLLPDDAARRRHRAAHERRRSAQVRHLDGRGGPAAACRCPGAKLTGLVPRGDGPVLRACNTAPREARPFLGVPAPMRGPDPNPHPE